MKAKPIHFYRNVLSALLFSIIGQLILGEHLSTLLPAWIFAPGGDRNLPPWLAWAVLGVNFAVPVWWLRPIDLYASKGREELKDVALDRYAGLFRFIVKLNLIIAAFWITLTTAADIRAAGTFHMGAFLARRLIPAAVGAYYGIYLTILFLEPYLFATVAPRLYEGEPLRGPSLGIRWKLWLLLLSIVVVPMLMAVGTLVTNRGEAWEFAVATLIFSAATVIGYGEALYRGIIYPLTSLSNKMRRVAQGDFGARSKVYGDDEIGVIKRHFNLMVEGLQERERIKDTFGKYVSVEIAKTLLESGKIDLGGENIEATILFSDIRNFTGMSGRLSPEKVVAFLNEYFKYVTKPIQEHHGVINKFIGDAVMAVFAPQFGSENHAEDGLRAALGMREALKAFNAAGVFDERVRFGVGLHTGTLVAGNVGTEARLEWTLIGDTVNMASRIESQTKLLDSEILISDAMHAAVSHGGREFVQCADVEIRGRKAPMTLYKVR